MKITFLGAAGEVTGSQHLIETDNLRRLLDCGLFQGQRRESRLKNMEFHCRPKELDGVILSHAHIDHCGNLPGLYRAGFKGTIFCTDATADIAMTLILMTARRAGEGERILRAGKWGGWGPVQMLGMHVTGRTVGIIGMGRIGKAIAARCHHGFGMTVLFHNRSAVTDLALPATQVPMDQAMAADIVVVAVPGGASTHHLINAAALAQMQPHALFINISRGDVVDEPALISCLQAGGIAGAGLDVYEFEPLVPPALIAMENVTLLPHLGTAALEVREAMGLMAVDNLVAHLEGRTPPNQV